MIILPPIPPASPNASDAGDASHGESQPHRERDTERRRDGRILDALEQWLYLVQISFTS